MVDKIDIHFQTEFIQEIQSIWKEWSNSRMVSYASKYGNLLQLLELPVDEDMIRAATHFWDPRRRCFNFNGIDLVPTLEEYRRLLGLPKKEGAPIFQPKPQKSCKIGLSHFLGHKTPCKDHLNMVLEQDGRELIPWEFLEEEMRGATEEKVHAITTLAIYGLVIFPKVLGTIDGKVFELTMQVARGADPTPAILAETIRSLTFIRTAGSGQFMGCFPLLCTWLKSHLPCKTKNFREVFSWPPTPLSDILKSTWELPRSLMRWKKAFRDMKEENLVWRAPWMPRDDMIYRCGQYNWVPLLGPWGGTAYAPLQGARQLENHQIVPILFGMEKYDIKHGIGKAESIAARMFQAWTKPQLIELTPHYDDVVPAYYLWRHQLERDTLRQENRFLKQLTRGQEETIKRLTQRIHKREELLEAIAGKKQRKD